MDNFLITIELTLSAQRGQTNARTISTRL